ncbi:ROK family protein [Galactobacter caseinivorans]|uniref:ROK family protein n=1 Tax=Galactobacter caseinivorans TaxID=2676123 RepID=A0A496PGH5_9MICC|nr:ROK family protein [Galactobacter caseinivorans]RKW69577.1 ROK family protein [Galactobacter caseinivorans]
MPEAPGPLLLFDVGGTDVKAAVAHGPDGVLGPVTRVPVQVGDASGAALVEQLAGLAARLLPSQRPAAVGLLIPGIVDEAARISVFAANLGLRRAPLADALAARLGVPVGLGHDVGMAAEAELLEGAGAHDAASVLVAVIGTGIAASAFMDGRRVAAPGAGELGHVPVPGGLQCSCGAVGCLETVASAAAIAREYERRTGVRVRGAEEVLRRGQQGDSVAIEVWAGAVEALAFGLHWCIGLFGTDRVIVGGGLSGAGEQLLSPLRAALARRLSFMPVPELVTATLGADAGLRGARLVALRRLEQAHAEQGSQS